MAPRDHPVTAYARSVLAGEVPAGPLHRAACQRHLDDCDRAGNYVSGGTSTGTSTPLTTGAETEPFPYVFDPARADRALALFPTFVHWKGQWAGTPIVLEPWQVFVVGSIFGWVHRDTRRRRFRTAYVELPRKNGKSLLAAGILLILGFFDHEPGAESYCAATKRDQAAIVFDNVKALIKAHPQLRDRLTLRRRAISQPATGSILVPLSADYDSMDGLNIHAAVLDEYHAQTTRGIVDVLETGMGARRQPHLLMITTAGADHLSPCGAQHTYVHQILTRTAHDETLFGFVTHAPEDADPFAESTWRMANPNYGISVLPEDMAAMATKAKAMPDARQAFRQKRLNIWVESGTPWLNMEAWRASQSPPGTWTPDPDRPCWAGLDLAAKIDTAAVVVVWPPAPDDPTWRVRPWVLTPEDGLDAQRRRTRAPFPRWAEEGHLHTNPGPRIDQDVIKARVLALAAQYHLLGVGVDPWNAGKLIGELNTLWQEAGAATVALEVPQTYRGLTDGSKELAAEIITGRVDAEGHPVLTWMLANTVAVTDENGNIRPSKKRSRGPIDATMALVMGMGLHLAAEEITDPYADGEGITFVSVG